MLLMRHFALLKISSEATEPLRCHNCVYSNDDDGSSERVAVLKMRHFAVLEMKSGCN